MGSVQWLKSTPGLGFSAEHPAPHADVLTSPYASYLGFLPEERVIDAASVDGEVHAVAEDCRGDAQRGEHDGEAHDDGGEGEGELHLIEADLAQQHAVRQRGRRVMMHGVCCRR